MWKVLVLVVIFRGFHPNRCQFMECDYDSTSYTPDEGPLDDIKYTWLATLQYIHITKGTPHYFRVPRVILITRQYVLSVAKDAYDVPDGYALGNIVFGEYERDEAECHLTRKSLAEGAECDLASVLVPIADVVLHPEYKHFGVVDSIALLKMLSEIKSRYMVPVCLPLKNYLKTEQGEERKQIYLVDFSIDVPRDIMEEEKEVTKVSVLPKELCYLYDNDGTEVTIPETDNIICTTGCGFHLGASSIIHEHTGHWTVVALSLGGSPCPDPLRSGRPPHPPRHIAIYPYMSWIKETIVGRVGDTFDNDDPFGFEPRALESNPEDLKISYNGHWWLGGLECYSRGPAAANIFKFYHEIFQVRPKYKMRLNYYLKLVAAYGSEIVCIKVGMPIWIETPRVWNLNSPEALIRIPVLDITNVYKFQVEAFAENYTKYYVPVLPSAER